MKDSLPAATWPTSKVPPLLCCGAISKVSQSETLDRRKPGEGERTRCGGVESLSSSLTTVMLEFLVVFGEIKVLSEGPQAQLSVQMLPIMRSRSGFSSQTCRGALTVQICEEETLHPVIHPVQTHFQAVILLFQINLSRDVRLPLTSIQPKLGLLCIYSGFDYSGLVIVVFFIEMIFHYYKSCYRKGRRTHTQTNTFKSSDSDPDHL